MLLAVIPSVCEESFPIVLMLIGVDLHHYPIVAVAVRMRSDVPEFIEGTNGEIFKGLRNFRSC